MEEEELKPTALGTAQGRIGDVSKLVRAVEDAMTGIVYNDDAPIIDLIAHRRFANDREQPCAIITVSAVPNLSNVITTDDVSQKGTGSYKADYVNWCRVAHLLQDHCPGFHFHLTPSLTEVTSESSNETAYVVGHFTGPNGERTPDFPQAVMDNRNNPVPYAKVTARDLTDTHRRALAACSAFTFGLAWQLWAREEIENPHTARKTEPQHLQPKLTAFLTVISHSAKTSASKCLGLIKELKEDNLASFLADFRRSFGLSRDAKVAPALTSKKHQLWMNEKSIKYV